MLSMDKTLSRIISEHDKMFGNWECPLDSQYKPLEVLLAIEYGDSNCFNEAIVGAVDKLNIQLCANNKWPLETTPERISECWIWIKYRWETYKRVYPLGALQIIYDIYWGVKNQVYGDKNTLILLKYFYHSHADYKKCDLIIKGTLHKQINSILLEATKNKKNQERIKVISIITIIIIWSFTDLIVAGPIKNLELFLTMIAILFLWITTTEPDYKKEAIIKLNALIQDEA